MMKKIALCAGLTLLAACQTTSQHVADVRQAREDDRLTVGTVQREIHVGMTSAEVVEVLGAPNMVSTDEQRREVWVYDRVSTETAYSTSSGGGSILILGASGGSGARSSSQRTLTIIIKYDAEQRVRDFSYRSSSF